jgi:hypothetical protein
MTDKLVCYTEYRAEIGEAKCAMTMGSPKLTITRAALPMPPLPAATGEVKVTGKAATLRVKRKMKAGKGNY